MKKNSILIILMLAGLTLSGQAQKKWTSLFNGKDLSGWFVHGKARWSVQNGILVGEGGMGHNPGMKIEAKDLFYRVIIGSE